MSEESQVDQLLHQLGEHNWEIRQAAIIELVAMGEIVANRLMRIIASDQPTIPHDYLRTHAADILGRLKFVDAIALLTNATTDESPAMREHSAMALGNIGDNVSIPTLLRLLREDTWPGVRESAAWALRRFRQPDVYRTLVNALADDEDFVIEAAFDALVEMGNGSKAYITEGLQHDKETVRHECRSILNSLEDASRDEHIWGGLNDESVWMRLLTVTKLWDLCRAEIIPGLKVALNDPYRDIRLTAVLALKCIDTEEAREIIVTAKADEDATIRKIVYQVIDQQ